MKQITLAKQLGFCFGVKRAIEVIQKLSGTKKVYVLGELIHNPQVMEQLEKKGVKMINDCASIKEGTIVISAHGTADSIVEGIKKKGLDVADLTCPFVKRVQETAKTAEKEGRTVIIFGDNEHTEVKGIAGNLRNFKIIKNAKELKEEDLSKKTALISQTTMNTEEFQKTAEEVRKAAKDIKVYNTICPATTNRQKEAEKLAKKSDIMIVIGGKNSSNTKQLAKICMQHCETRHIETEKELKKEWFNRKEKIGITAGASTPDKTIKRVKQIIVKHINNGTYCVFY